ncbi:MAG: hypothetical protein K6E94_04975 [Elusimicrobiaceae bacterium]|nr:hypothetical protein [Elusimicrobiaceae bacterium]
MWKHFKKFISVSLIFSLMLNILSTGFAQAVSEYENINIKELEINAIAASLKEIVAAENEKKTYKENFIKQTEQEDRETFLTRQRLQKYFQKEYQFNRVMDSFNQQLYSQAAKEWKRLDYKEDKFNLDAQAEVCYGETCYPYKIFMKALISAWLEYHVQGEADLSIYNAKYLQEAAFLGAISLEDKRELFNLLKEGIKQESYVCGKSGNKEEEKCEDILTGLTVLSEIWETDTESKEVSDLIYKILEKYYDSKFGIMVLIQSIASLSFIDTDYSYSLIEKFLTQDTAPTKIGNKTREALEMFSITGEYETWTEYFNNLVKEGAHYLNRHNIIWQYIKEEETRAAKVDPAFINTPGKVLDKSENSVLASYRVVYGNILTDIGEFLSNQEGRGKRLAAKIVKQYINASEEDIKKIHIPLVLGLIQNLDSGDAALAADRLQRTFYYDINSGTGKWVQEKATVGGKYAYNYPPNVRSEKDYLDFVKTKKLTTFGDILIIFASLITLAKKIPDIIFKIKNLANLIKLRRMASYGSAVVVGNVADVAKTAKVTPAITTVAPKTAITMSGTSAVNVLSKIRNVAKTPVLLTKGAKDGLSLAAPSLTLTSGSLSLTNSVLLVDGVFHLIDPEGDFSGFLAEIPVFGINRQVIISAGHVIGVMPEAPVIVLDKNNNIKTTAHLVFSDFAEKGDKILKDFSLLLPMHRLPRTPLQLDFNPKLEDYSKFWYIGYPNGKFLMKNLHPVFEESTKDILIFDEEIGYGGSGGLVFGEKQGQFFGLGTSVAKHWRDGSWTTTAFTFNWLDKFIKGKLDISKLWAPNFRESFIKPDRTGNLPDIPFNDGIISIKNAESQNLLGQTKPQQNIDSGIKLRDITLPIIAIGTGLMLTSVFNASAPLLTLASFPFFGRLFNFRGEVIRKDEPPAPVKKESIKESMFNLAKSVFHLGSLNREFSGFLVEIPIYGVKRQAIITAGHAVSHAPGSEVDVYDMFGNLISEAHPMFFNYNLSNKTVFNGVDYALLLPDYEIHEQPLELNFDDDIYNYKKIIKMGYPNGELSVETASPLPDIRPMLPSKNLSFLSPISEKGISGGPVFVESAPNKFSVIGISVSTADSSIGGFSLVNDLNWLKKFIKGEPIRAFFRNPIYPPSPFISSNPRYAKIAEAPMDISDQISDEERKILSGGELNLQLANTSFQFDKPYLPWESFNSYEKATLFPMGNISSKTSPFWLVSDVTGNINKFLYYGTETDVYRMHLFDQIIKENNLDTKYKLIDIKYPEFITVIDEDLPLNVSEDFAEIKVNAHYRKEEFVPYTTTPIKLNGAVWVEKDPVINAEFLENSAFVNHPITQAEWDEIEALIQDINNYGFVFDDLESSLILTRNEEGKLVVGVKKFKDSVLLSDNYSDVNSMGKHYERVGLKADRNGVVRNISKKDIELNPNVLKNVNRAEMVITDYGPDVVTHAVWRLYDNVGKNVGYLKYGTEDELINMKKMHQIITENNLLDKFDAINIQYQRILTENPEKFLPKKVLDEVYQKFTSNINLIRNPSLRAKVMFVTAPIEFEAFCWGNLGTDEQSVMTAKARLKYKPITANEWEQIFNFFMELETLGFKYDDLYNNLELGRDKNFKLNVLLKDLETEGSNTDILKEIKDIGNTFNAYGLKEPSPKIDNVDLIRDESYYLPY